MVRAGFDVRANDRYSSAIRLAQVCSAKQDRARRAKHLSPDLFSEPAWDILLELYSVQLVGRRVSESEIVKEVPAPASVSLRWVKVLESQGLIARAADPKDPPQVSVTLTTQGLEAMEAYFSGEG